MIYFILLPLILSPAYAVRFELFGMPLNLLMVLVPVVWLAFLLDSSHKKQWGNFRNYLKSIDVKIATFALLFFLSGVFSLFWNGFTMEKLGQFLVLFLQPMSMFLIVGFEFRINPESKNILLASCYLLLALIGTFAALQYFTLICLPESYWGNNVEPKRAISLFTHPNFYSLFAAPLLAFLIPDVVGKLRNLFPGATLSAFEGSQNNDSSDRPVSPSARQGGLHSTQNDAKIQLLFPTFWLIGAFGLLLSMSRAGWLGLAVAFVVYAIAAGDKKIRLGMLGLGIVAIACIFLNTNLRYRALLPFYGEKSAVSRLSLWETGWKGVKESPVMGLGLTGFSQNWDRLNTDPNIDRHNYPHNIFLNLWVETGIIGLISLIGLIGLIIWRGLGSTFRVIPSWSRNHLNMITKGSLHSSDAVVGRDDMPTHPLLPIILFLLTFLTQGLLDNPYFKNDLAMVFWIILSLAI